nr:MAG TPA: repressor domain protein [Caudoviricetes sp.]
MNMLETFNHEEFGKVRILLQEGGEAWFHGRDIAIALGYAKPENAIATHCKSDGTLKQGIAHSNGVGSSLATFINEANLYRLIMRSKLESAERFQDWVVEEVLPSIRKTGSYSVAPKTSAELLLAQAQLLVDLERRQIETEQTIRHQQEELNSLKSDVDHMLEVRETAKEQLEFLPLSENTSPEQTLRSKINQIVKAYVSLTGVSYPEAWDSVYKNLYYKYSISVRAIKPVKKGENNLSKLERKGHLEAVYTVVSEMLRDGK